MKRIFGLDILRAMAIIGVLLCHFLDVFYSFTGGVFEVFFNYSLFMFGYYGVEIFFILSGFLIGSIFLKAIVASKVNSIGTTDIGNFLMKRWFRTIPNYLLFVLINFIVYYILNDKMFNGSLWKYFLFLQAVDYKSSINFFGVSWSLAVEEWFYLTIAIAFLISFYIIKLPKHAFLVSVGVIFALPFLLKLNYCISNPVIKNHTQVFVYTTFYRLDSIGFGVLLAWIYSIEKYKNYLVVNSRRLLFLGIGLILFSLLFAFFFLVKNQQHSLSYFIFSPICDTGIALCFPFFLQVSDFKSQKLNRIIMVISLSSYSLYLCHIPIKQLFDHGTKNYIWLNQSFVGAGLKFVFLVLVSIFLAHLNYKYFEVPILRFRDRFGKKLTPKHN